MSWSIITDDWRLKLLALGLAVLMLGAVAFSQNPPTSGTATVGLTYANIPPSLILVNPPTSVPVTYTGVADEIAKVNSCVPGPSACLLATVDLAKAKPGTKVQLNVVAKSTVGRDVSASAPPIAVTIDTYAQNVPVQVEVTARAGAGWSITKQVSACPSSPCVVHFSGPSSWTKNLSAYVSYTGQVSLTSIDSPNQPIHLQNINGNFDLSPCKTDPCATLDLTLASIHIEAVPGSNSSTVTLLDGGWSHGPAQGYRVTEIDITPDPIVVTGDLTTLGKLRNITLPAVDLSGRTSTTTFQVAIPYPDGVSGNVANALVKYVIAPNPSISPSPSP